MKELTLPDPVALQAFRQKFEAGRSFDLDDDLEFCPNLLTESDVSTHHLPTTGSRGQACSCTLASMTGSTDGSPFFADLFR